MSGRVLMAEVSGGRVWGRPRLVWMDLFEGGFGQQMDDDGGCALVGGLAPGEW